MVGLVRATALALALGLACASGPPAVAPGTGAIWGELRLVPRAGVAPGGGGGAYGDRRLEGVTFVDYSRPGFAVVYVEGDPDPDAAPLSLRIEDGPVAPGLSPKLAAQRLGGRLHVENASGTRHAVSCPEAGLIAALEPGARLEIEVPDAGELGVYLLDVPGAESRVFVAPGPYALVSRSGRFELLDLPPGAVHVRAWHPRFPPVSEAVRLAPGVATRVDLEMGVALDAEAGDDAR